jgi:glutamyl-Q tRNA(Asp) synthetase
VIRGRDLFASTHLHRLLQVLLDVPAPIYRHHSLVTNRGGERLAKRAGAPSLHAMRLRGDSAESVLLWIMNES